MNDQQYKERLLERSKEVGVDYHSCGLIRQLFYDFKMQPGEMITWLENKLKNIYRKSGRRFKLYSETIEILKQIPYPKFEEITKPYET